MHLIDERVNCVVSQQWLQADLDIPSDDDIGYDVDVHVFWWLVGLRLEIFFDYFSKSLPGLLQVPGNSICLTVPSTFSKGFSGFSSTVCMTFSTAPGLFSTM
ncbi:hypothetical protein J7T55_009710 [Diaporthe amygdali]|uniref:uncharacterized protein n=1 Tax=Phomopsis amygdali TaxID=1214568 RepID=UPI0022FE897D|nr:uncharacterized protein J7T55_009710 [Diaporthe amygdali]KAJ0104045.1 hypothetical protein J7T55_009710 [Diaporthe amygdali]